MKNNFTVEGDVVSITLNRRNSSPLYTKISLFDIEKAQSFKGSWNAQYDKNVDSFYVVGNIKKEDGRHSTVRLHTFLLNPDKHLQVDHINNDTLNNTRENLRIVTNAQNAQNRKGAYRNNQSSKVRGVSWSTSTGKWRARAILDYKEYHLGYFYSIEEAEKAVIIFRKERMEFSKEAI